MTLIMAAAGRKSIWLSADQRLTAGALSIAARPRVIRDDAKKITMLDTTDGNAILGYAGLGATSTANRTEPADWIVKVLRGINAPLEPSLKIIERAMHRQFPPHLRGTPYGRPFLHSIVAPAFLGRTPMLYTIDFIFAADRKTVTTNCTRRNFNQQLPGIRFPRLAAVGSGVQALNKIEGWERKLTKLIEAHERNGLPAAKVADYLAELNHSIHATEKSVGSRCIVAWRYPINGGAHRHYDGISEIRGKLGALPTIGRGMDLVAIFDVLMPLSLARFKQMEAGNIGSDDPTRNANEALARLPFHPDEKLR